MNLAHKLKTIVLILPALIVAFSSRPSAAREKRLVDYIQNGQVSPDYWKSRLSKLPTLNEKLEVIRSNDIWKLINTIPTGYDLDELAENIDSPKAYDFDPKERVAIKSALKKLEKLGFVLEGYSHVEKVDDRFNIWELQQNVPTRRYLIDMRPPMKAYDFLPGGSTPHILHIEKMKDGVDRFFVSDAIENGRLAGTQQLQVFDVDFAKGTYREWEASYLFGGEKVGWDVLVDEKELDFFINWDWIYKWDGRDWVDVSAEYPDFYKTKVFPVLKQLKGIPGDPQRNEILRAFKDAAAKGGPAALKKH